MLYEYEEYEYHIFIISLETEKVLADFIFQTEKEAKECQDNIFINICSNQELPVCVKPVKNTR